MFLESCIIWPTISHMGTQGQTSKCHHQHCFNFEFYTFNAIAHRQVWVDRLDSSHSCHHFWLLLVVSRKHSGESSNSNLDIALRYNNKSVSNSSCFLILSFPFLSIYLICTISQVIKYTHTHTHKYTESGKSVTLHLPIHIKMSSISSPIYFCLTLFINLFVAIFISLDFSKRFP